MKIRSRFLPVGICLAFYLIVCTILRATLLHTFGPAAVTASEFVHVFWVGFRMDLVAGLALLVPLVFWLTFLPTHWYRTALHRHALYLGVTVFFVALVFNFKVEIEFFREFNARFNTVAVDYLIYPTEVFTNLWESYPIVTVFLISLIVGVLCSLAVRRVILDSGESQEPLRRRTGFLVAYLVVIVAFKLTVNYHSSRFSTNRVLDEIATNGQYSFAWAGITRDLEYTAYYQTIPIDDAYARTRKLVAQPGTAFIGDAHSIARTIPGKTGGPKNVVVILVESFGAEFWGSLNPGQKTWTPEMDALTTQGRLYTNMYASGNRTVRGMEGVLASFPPLPGDSIVKRDMSDNVATLARTLKTAGYQTLFMYGGRGVFDGMRSFCDANGYDRFIEEKDFPHPTFKTIWGVCDEDLFHRGIEELRALHEKKKPFFVTFLTVSNHQPYTYPPGRIPENPEERHRTFAVKYTDWAIGDFFKRVEKEPFFKDTVFAVVADHGARVYGSQTIPIKSYRIPLLIVAPNVKPGSRNGTLGSSLDVGPTMLGLVGLPYKSTFFGRDLEAIAPDAGWVPMNHNRDISFFRGNRMIVLGINNDIEHYEMRGTDIVPVPGGPQDADLDADGEALFEVANDLYVHKRYVTP